MEGYVNEYGQPIVEVTVEGSRGSIIAGAILNTGFDGDICLPTQVAIQLGLELVTDRVSGWDEEARTGLHWQGHFWGPGADSRDHPHRSPGHSNGNQVAGREDPGD